VYDGATAAAEAAAMCRERKRRVTLVGADLCMLDYSPLGVQVIGTLLAVEFGDL
jgi:glycine cleavage system pyridoxal-binding protein P